MSTNTNEDFLSMSDEDVLNLPEPALEQVSNPDEAHVPDESGELQAPKDESADTPDLEKPTETDSEEGVENAGSGDVEERPQKTEDKQEAADSSEEKDKDSSTTIDYQKEYERILAPFKANGREVKVDSVDDAITLMKMGANYNKKMAALKPNLKVLKLLEKNGLLDETKLSFLIDLDKKNPEAINKLVNDSGLDPMDLDTEKANNYKQQIHTVDDREIMLDEVLDDIQDTPTFARTLGIVTKEWDVESKSIIADHPQLLRIINDHVERGIYDLIQQTVDRERMMGRLTGLSDLEAYRQVGDAIDARGGFDHLVQAQPGNKAPAAKVVTPKPKSAESDDLKARKRAAGVAPSHSLSGEGKDDFNPLALSDEEFEKIAEQKFR